MDEEKNVPPQLRDIDDADRHHNDRIKVSWEGGVDNLLKHLQDEETERRRHEAAWKVF